MSRKGDILTISDQDEARAGRCRQRPSHGAGRFGKLNDAEILAVSSTRHNLVSADYSARREPTRSASCIAEVNQTQSYIVVVVGHAGGITS